MISVIIVNYKTYELTYKTLDNLLKSDVDEQLEIIVVDNNSKDGSVEKLRKNFKQVIFIENDKNYGFAKANNIGIKASHGDYILLLNSDVEVYKDTISSMAEYIRKDNSIGALGPKLILSDGTLDHTCKRGFPTPGSSLYYFLGLDKKHPNSKKYGRYRMTFIGEDETHEVDSIVGAFMLIPKIVLDKIGLLDEKFFMYGEDIDLCFRIKKAGYKVIYYPVVEAIHYKGGSSSKKSYRLIYEFYRAMLIFYSKHYRNKYPFYITFAVYLGILGIMAVKFIANFFKGDKK